MTNSTFHYTECGLPNIFLVNGFNFIETARGVAVSIKDVEGLHQAIGHFLVTNKRDLTGKELRFLRHEMLMSQSTLANLLGMSEQAVRRWESNKVTIPKPSESLLRLLYREHIHNQNGKISTILKKIANLEEKLNDQDLLFEDTLKGWKTAI